MFSSYQNKGVLGVIFQVSIAVITLYLFSSTGMVRAQQTSAPTVYTNIIPPSPNAATFQRYGDYPVSYATGLPEISIPIYQIQENHFDFPITLSYHASGRNTAMNFSSLGINWALNASGIISRVIKGRPDQLPYQAPPFLYTSIMPLYNHYDAVAEMAYDNPFIYDTSRDSQHDIFSYNVSGKSGKFIIDSGKSILLSGDPYKIEPLSENYFRLTDENGVQYLFGNTSGDTCGGAEFPMIPSNGPTYYSSWLLNTITTPLGEQIKFKYGSVYSTSSSNSTIWGNMNVTEEYVATDEQNTTSSTATIVHNDGVTSFQEFFMNYIQEIDFDKGKVLFSYDSNLKLTNCNIQDNAGNKIKGYNFGYQTLSGENLPNNNSVLLNSLSIKDKYDSVIEKYSYTYNLKTPSVPTWTYSEHRDWWGYYRGYYNSGAVNSNVPATTVDLAPNSGNTQFVPIGSDGAQTPNFACLSYGMLTKISYPTGGSTQFVYEPNRYIDNSGILNQGPGLRVQQIISDDGTGNKITKSYKYGINENGAGKILYVPRASDFVTDQYTIDLTNTLGLDNSGSGYQYRTRIYSTQPNPSVAEAYSYPVYYPQVTEYQQTNNNINLNNGKTIYNYSTPRIQTVYVPMDGSIACTPVFFVPCTDAKLIDKTVYASSNNSYTKLSEDIYTYNNFDSTNIPEVFLARYINFVPYPPDPSSQKFFAVYPQKMRVFVYQGVNVIAAANRLTFQQHTDYANGQPATTSTSYQYNNLAHLFPTLVTVTNSTGDVITTTSKYPWDYANITGTDAVSQGIKKLSDLHIIAPVVEKSIYRSNVDGTNNRLLSSLFTAYKPTVPLPDNISAVDIEAPVTNFIPSSVSGGVITRDSRYVPRVSFNLYGNYGTILEQQRVNDVKEVYLWGYNSHYPVAKIIGSDHSTVSALINQSVLDNPVNDLALRTELDKIRTGIPNLQMHTYSYSPLVGMTSEVDPKGNALYYDYDGIGRLNSVKDQNSNVVKKISYNYLGNTNTSDVLVYTSAEQSAIFTRNNCNTGLVGSNLRYTVPAGSFISTISQNDADQQALNAVSNYGQIYANIYGTCTVPVVTTTVQLSYNISSVISNTPVSVAFQSSTGTTVQTSSFPRGSGPYNSATLPVGSYNLQFTLPSAYAQNPVTFTINPGGTTWSSSNGAVMANGSILLNGGQVTFNQGTTYSITITQ